MRTASARMTTLLSLLTVLTDCSAFNCGCGKFDSHRVFHNLSRSPAPQDAATLYVPAGVNPIVFFGSDNSSDEYGIIFYDEAGQYLQEIDLVNQEPPGTCLGAEIPPRTLLLAGIDVSTRTIVGLSITRETDTRYYDVKIGPAGQVVAQASIGLPATASNQCRYP